VCSRARPMERHFAVELEPAADEPDQCQPQTCPFDQALLEPLPKIVEPGGSSLF
jgi:hypothetical protein